MPATSNTGTQAKNSARTLSFKTTLFCNICFAAIIIATRPKTKSCGRQSIVHASKKDPIHDVAIEILLFWIDLIIKATPQIEHASPRVIGSLYKSGDSAL